MFLRFTYRVSSPINFLIHYCIYSNARYDLELHLVHKSPDLSVKNRVAVVGHLYQFGEPDAFLSEVNPSGKPLLSDNVVFPILQARI